MNNIFLNIVLFGYFFILIVFDNAMYIKYVYIANILLLVYFLVSFLGKKQSIKKDRVVLLYSIFAVICFISSIWSIDFDTSFRHSITVVLMAINMFVIYTLISINKSVNAVFNAFIAGVFINFLFSFSFIGDIETYYTAGKFSGTLFHANLMSTLLLMSIFISSFYLVNVKNKIYRLLNIVNIVISMYLILLTVSKKGLLIAAMFIILQIFFSLKSVTFLRKSLLILLFAPILIYFSTFIFDYSVLIEIIDNIVMRMDIFWNYIFENVQSKENSTEERIHFIYMGLQIFSENIFLGNGIRSFNYLFGSYSHNNYIELLANVGLLGFISYYSMYMVLFYRTFQIKIKKYRILFIILFFSFLIIDMTIVTYYSKIIISMFVVLAWKLKNIRNIKNEKN